MLFAYANFDFTTMDVYGRKNGENSFSLLQSNITEEELEIPSSWSVYTDFAAVLTNEYGFSFKTEPISIAIEENDWYSVYGVDTDKDSVPDAYELWLAGTNPNTPDTFPNSEFYVCLAGEEDTTCYDRLLRRDVSVTTDEFTKTFLYEETDYPGRATGADVCYTDGTTKRIRYEYENDRLKRLHVGNNTYTIQENENGIRYFINNTCIKQISQTENATFVNHYDTVDEISRFDSEANLISYQNGSLYEMTYDNLDLMTGLAKNGVPYAAYTYDDYGVFLTIDATDYSIHYTYDYPRYQADYTFGGQNPVQKTQKVNCKDDAYAYGDIVLLTDGTNGAKIPTTFLGEILSGNPDTRTLQYRIGEETYTVKFNARGYVVKDTVTKAGTTETTVNEYSYDAYGNLQTVKTTKNGQTTVQRYSYSSAWSDELTSFDGRAITYDTLGKPTEYYNGMSFTWAAGKLATVQNGEKSVSYRYDYQGLREEKTVNGVTTKYLYEGHDLIAELSEEPIYFTYDGSFNLVGFEWNGTAYYYQYDIFGDVVSIVNAAGETLCTYSYDLWGAITGITGDQALAERNPIRYRGYYYDNETGFYYLETRYYDPQVKRFLSYDDLESFFYGAEEDMESLFVYCGNNPVFFCDTDGMASSANNKTPVIGQIWTTAAFNDSGTKLVQSDLKAFLRSRFNSSMYEASVDVLEVNNDSQFEQRWYTLRRIEILIVRGHSHAQLAGGLSLDMAKTLPKRDIGVLLLEGCNCGHYDVPDNIAKTLSKKVTGFVIASDGEVLSLLKEHMYYRSAGGKAFVEWRNEKAPGSTRQNYGWIKFKYGYVYSKLGMNRAWYTLSQILSAAGI
ncbi:MAG: RHS repeat-associated core domain-containing protein [Lachnospiraceae bacterium]|nr:RHS repeat-associated core domain-containing protein [Lachnospiraceae bacterium]